ncbi:MAG: aceF [Mucilaginibacter sp.]|nr:aceF [Mucilaginibacter sp.]
MAKYKLLLPKMGESVAEATIIKWTKNPGDYIEADETVMEIATDKVDSDVPSPVSGKLVEKLYNDNDVVQVGAVIAIIETNEPEEDKEQTSHVAAPQPFKAEQPTAFHEAVPETVEHISDPAIAPAPEQVKAEDLKPPVFAEQQAQAVPYTPQPEQRSVVKTDEPAKNPSRFYSPLVKNIAAQEGISNDELDKIPGTGAEGRLTKDDLLAYIQNKFQPEPGLQNIVSQVDPSAVAEPVKTETATLPTQEPKSEITESEPAVEMPPSEPIPEIKQQAPIAEAPEQAPAAKPVAAKPVMETPPAPSVNPVSAETRSAGSKSMSGGDEVIEMDRMRRLIADHMVMSKQTSPHVTSFVEADVTNIVLWREKIKSSFEKREGEKITFTPIFIEAVVRAIKDLPMINIQVNGTQIIKKKDINISMATALPSGNLIVPVIKKADTLSLLGLTKAVNDLASRARTGKLKPDDVQGGTFTITNVGSFGNVMGTPIINQPQVAILAVGAIKKKPAVIETLQGDMIGIRHMMFLSLSYDHRVVDGSLGGSFVKRVADYLENWDPGREI